MPSLARHRTGGYDAETELRRKSRSLAPVFNRQKQMRRAFSCDEGGTNEHLEVSNLFAIRIDQRCGQSARKYGIVLQALVSRRLLHRASCDSKTDWPIERFR